MNRAARDYCSKGRHRNWRAWTARYGSQTRPPYALFLIGVYCDLCGRKLELTETQGRKP